MAENVYRFPTRALASPLLNWWPAMVKASALGVAFTGAFYRLNREMRPTHSLGRYYRANPMKGPFVGGLKRWRPPIPWEDLKRVAALDLQFGIGARRMLVVELRNGQNYAAYEFRSTASHGQPTKVDAVVQWLNEMSSRYDTS